jgi:hypothetical protein
MLIKTADEAAAALDGRAPDEPIASRKALPRTILSVLAAAAKSSSTSLACRLRFVGAGRTCNFEWS